MNKNAVKLLLSGLFLIITLAIALFFRVRLEKQRYPMEYTDIVAKYADEYGLDPYLVSAIMIVESRCKKDAVSRAGAQGLMQLMPATAEWAAKKLHIEEYDVFSPETNIEMACWYLRFLSGRFDSVKTICAAYNAGHGRVQEWLEDPLYSGDGVELTDIPYPETRDYVVKVQTAYEKIRQIYPKAYTAKDKA